MCTGLEPLLLGMGASAAGASALATGIGGIGAAALGSKALKSMAPKAQAPQIPTPVAPPQPTRQADRTATFAGTAAGARPGGAFAGNSGTFLTGPSGIDPSGLNLGKNVLLGR